MIFFCGLHSPHQKKLFKRDSIKETIPDGALKKEREGTTNNYNLSQVQQHLANAQTKQGA